MNVVIIPKELPYMGGPISTPKYYNPHNPHCSISKMDSFLSEVSHPMTGISTQCCPPIAVPQVVLGLLVYIYFLIGPEEIIN